MSSRRTWAHTHIDLSLDTDNKYLSSWENSKRTTVSVCPLPTVSPTQLQLEDFHSRIFATASVFATHAEAINCPSREDAKAYTWSPWPYNFSISGHKVRCLSSSSTGGLCSSNGACPVQNRGHYDSRANVCVATLLATYPRNL